MPTLERAKVIQANMGGRKNIYWDCVYSCFRVMEFYSRSLENNYKTNQYILIDSPTGF